jgi:aminomethyltransferase
MTKDVQLQDLHRQKGHLVEYAGFNLSLWFAGITPESLAVRNAAGIFDISHMGRALIRGRGSRELLERVTTNDVTSLKVGQGQYSLMCNPEGGIKDDIVVFHLQNEDYLVVYNASNRSKDYNWILENSRELAVDPQNLSDEVAMFSIQGPRARELVQTISNTDLAFISRFGCAWTELNGIKTLVTRTGYTGEDGYEIYVWDSPLNNPHNAYVVWNGLVEAGKPFGLQLCGLGARDLLRLEAGFCLYGNEMDENINPFEAKLSFTVRLHKDFIGRDRLVKIKEDGISRLRIGVVMEKRVIPRHGFDITVNGKSVGTVTSGTLSPLLNTGIAMGYVKSELAKAGSSVDIQVRGRPEKAKIVKPPFYDTSTYGYTRKLTRAC